MVKSAFHPCTAGRLRTGPVPGAEHLTLGVAQLRAARRAGCRAGGGGWWMVDGGWMDDFNLKKCGFHQP